MSDMSRIPRWRPLVFVVNLLAIAGVWLAMPTVGHGAQQKTAAEAKVLGSYEQDLRRAIQQRQKLVLALKALMLQNQKLRNNIMATAQTAELRMRQANQMPQLRAIQTSDPEDKRRDKDRDEDRDRERTRTVVVDQSGAKMALAASAMQMASMLPMLNIALQRTNSELAKIVEAGEANQQLYRSLADPFGRRSSLEAARARDVMGDQLLADPEDDGARLVLGFAYLRMGLRAAAEKQLSTLADRLGPFQAIALGARGHMRGVGWAGSDAATRKLGGGDLARAMAFKPRQADVCLFRGLVYWHEAKWGLAETELRAANTLKPDDVDALRLMALFYAVSPGAERKLANAEAAADRACTLTNQQDAACLEALAAVQARRGDWEKAESTQQQAVDASLGELTELAEKRLEAMRAKQPPAKTPPLEFADAEAPAKPAGPNAAEELDPLLALPEPGVAPNWHERVRILIRHKKWGPAANNLANVLNPQVINEEWFQYGCLLWLAGDKAGYQALCQRAIATNTMQAVRLAGITPDSGLLPVQLVQVAKNPTIIPTLRLPMSIESPHGLSLALYRAGDYDAARKTLERLLDQQQPQFNVNPVALDSSALLWQVVALTHAQEQNFADAREAAKHARALRPNTLLKEFPARDQVGLWLAYLVQDAELDRLLGRSP